MVVVLCYNKLNTKRWINKVLELMLKLAIICGLSIVWFMIDSLISHLYTKYKIIKLQRADMKNKRLNTCD